MDYTTWTLANLRAEFGTQSAIHDAAGRERRAIAAELHRRRLLAEARLLKENLTLAEREALKDVL